MSSNHEQVIDEVDADLVRWAIGALNKTQLRAINYVRGDGERTQPGARVVTSATGGTYYDYSPGLPRRQAHPTLWADVTGLTANQYGFEQPKLEGHSIVGSLFNTAPHADELEGRRRKEGGRYWILAGLDPDAGFESEFNIAQIFQTEFNALVNDDTRS